jgi:hypothetical protein
VLSARRYFYCKSELREGAKWLPAKEEEAQQKLKFNGN